MIWLSWDVFFPFFFFLFCFLRRNVHWQLAPYSLDVSLQTFQKAVCFIFHSQNYYICMCWKKPTSPRLVHPLRWSELFGPADILPPFLFLLKGLAHKLLTKAAGHTDLDRECLIRSSALVTCTGGKGCSLREISH